MDEQLEVAANGTGVEGGPEAFDQFASMTSATGSLMSGMEDGGSSAPSLIDIKRLQKLKADQEMRLKALCSRVDRLTSQEQQVWKDVAHTQKRSLQAQEKQWHRQAQEAERLRMERELMVHEQILRERAREMRLRTLEMKDVPRLQKFEENKAVSRQVKEESARQAVAQRRLRTQEVQAKSMQVELRRQERRQQKLQRDLVMSRQEQARLDVNMSRYAELQEEVANADLAIAVAEHEELSAVKRLQNSQSVRNEVVTQLGDIEKLSPHAVNDADGMPSPANTTPSASQPGARSGGGAGYARGPRSSPRLGTSSSVPSYAMPVSRDSRASGRRRAASAGRTDLGQITEEEAYAIDSKAASKKPPIGAARTRALPMQRFKYQPPGRPLSTNAVAKA